MTNFPWLFCENIVDLEMYILYSRQMSFVSTSHLQFFQGIFRLPLFIACRIGAGVKSRSKRLRSRWLSKTTRMSCRKNPSREPVKDMDVTKNRPILCCHRIMRTHRHCKAGCILSLFSFCEVINGLGFGIEWLLAFKDTFNWWVTKRNPWRF